MKKLFYLFCSLCMVTSLASCSNGSDTKEESTATPVASAESSETPEATSDTSTSTEVSLYDDETDMVELSFGITNELFTFKVPSSYVVTGMNMTVQDIEQAYPDLTDQHTTLKEAMDNGVFDDGYYLSSIEVRKLDAEDITLFSVCYLTSDISWEELVGSYENAKDIENSPYEAVTFDSEYLKKPCAAVSIHMGDYIFSFVYTGSLNDTVDHEVLSNALFNLITFK